MNKTHLYWEWENTHENNSSVFQDYLWIVQENHGMRNEPVEEGAKESIPDDILIWNRV